MGMWYIGIGVLLLIAELFLPGGFFGFVGFVIFVIGVVAITPDLFTAIIVIVLSLLLFAVILFLVAQSIPKNSLYKTLLLKTKLAKEEGFLSSKENDSHIGEIMEVETKLRPSGRLKKDGKFYDAMSESEFIQKGEMVEVVGNKGYILLVRRVQQ